MEMFLILALVVGVAIWALRSHAVIVISGKQDGVTVKGRISKRKQAEIAEFFQRDLALVGRWKVLGTRTGNGGLRLRFRGRISVAERQRIRNFLFATLCG